MYTFFRTTGGLYQQSIKADDGTPLPTSFTLEIIAERSGSFEVLIGIVLADMLSGIVGNEAHALTRWTAKRLKRWCISFLDTYRKAKTQSTNIERITASIEEFGKREGIPIRPSDAELVEALENIEDDDNDEEFARRLNKLRLLIEKLDLAIQNITTLLEKDCKFIEIVEPGSGTLLSFDIDDYYALHRHITLPPPEGIWRQVFVEFERINVKTGRAMGYLTESPIAPRRAPEFMRIVDPAIHTPPNAYTRAFNDGQPLRVWARQVGAEKRHLNLTWQISVIRPDQPDLFG
ncbi:MAG TPA: hypothetical protein VH253_09990 [Phycisphaerae bacterium]|nr:hypothetical protein [Phycisphaerae bacterium]